MASFPNTGISAREAMRRLVEGNRRFVSGKGKFRAVCRTELAELARGQKPYATILGCSDSRVPPEVLFDAGLGELFVIRVAGNTISPEVAGSLQYARMHLRTPLFVVLGHEGCGAVDAALQMKLHRTQHHRRLSKLLRNILPALKDLDRSVPSKRLMAQAVEANVRRAVHRIAQSPEGKAGLSRDDVMLLGAIYQIKTGRVKFLPASD